MEPRAPRAVSPHMADQNIIMNWLDEAYSMEHALAQKLERDADDLEGHPKADPELRAIREQALTHAHDIEVRVSALGGVTSDAKYDTAAATGIIAGLMDAFSNEY